MSMKNRRKNYPLYETTRFSEFREMVENAGLRFSERRAFVFRRNPADPEPQYYTYGEGREFVRDLGTEFIHMGMSEQTVALIGEASPEWVFSYFALMASGAVTVPLDKELPASELAATMKTAECRFLLYSPSVQAKIDEVRALMPELTACIALLDEPAEGVMTVGSVRVTGAARFADGDRSYYDRQIDPDRLATIVFTSGTTGKGKGVMLSQRNICADMEQGMYNFRITDRTLCVLPPHHTFGSTVNYTGHYALGCELYISSGLRYIMAELKEFRPTHLVLVPLFVENFYKRIINTIEKQGKTAVLQKLIRISDAMRLTGVDPRRKFFRSILDNFGGELEMIICGGAALNQKIIDFFESIGIVILNGYGITECAPLVSCNRNECRKPGSVGIPIIGGQLKIADPDENGEGEICYKGPNVMLGYYKNEAATAEAFDEEGYFRTGDYGKVVREGDDHWLYITGRLKNLIILSNGKNVYPEEIETEIQGIDGVGEVVVYAGESATHPDREVIVAEIFPDEDALKRRGITDSKTYFENAVRELNDRSVSYKRVGLVKLRNEEFPKNTSRKIIRFAIDKKID